MNVIITQGCICYRTIRELGISWMNWMFIELTSAGYLDLQNYLDPHFLQVVRLHNVSVKKLAISLKMTKKWQNLWKILSWILIISS